MTDESAAILDPPDVMRKTVLEYIRRINDHDVDGIIALMADDFRYINSAGDTFRGRAFMRQEWRRYFNLYPDYQIHVETVISGPEGVAVFGSAEGTYSADTAEGEDPEENHWIVPAAYFGTTTGGKILRWQTYSDSSIVFDIIKEHEAPTLPSEQ
ncbi:nuclear transport factor 2 family protein [Fontivita pretiosa]|uniref:nuclear transport factor 2 family protein n=1 Tax=Fontivita pretiosa TaxID=2989684 RepID=UPI003D17DB32